MAGRGTPLKKKKISVSNCLKGTSFLLGKHICVRKKLRSHMALGSNYGSVNCVPGQVCGLGFLALTKRSIDLLQGLNGI